MTINQSGSPSNLFINGEVRNIAVGGHGVIKTGVTGAVDAIFHNVKIITSGGGASSIVATDTVKVIHSVAANEEANPVFPTINAINPLGVANRSVAYFDALVE